MIKPAILKAEEKFAKVKRQEDRVLEETEKAQQEKAEKVARLKELRLIKEALDQ